jgi:hypothetical protein
MIGGQEKRQKMIKEKGDKSKIGTEGLKDQKCWMKKWFWRKEEE